MDGTGVQRMTPEIWVEVIEWKKQRGAGHIGHACGRNYRGPWSAADVCARGMWRMRGSGGVAGWIWSW